MSSDKKNVFPDFAFPATATSSPRGKHATPNNLNKNVISLMSLFSVIRLSNNFATAGVKSAEG